MPDANGQDLKSRLAAELGRDKKKTVVLTIVMIVAVVLVYTKLIKKKSPKVATAAQAAAAVPEPSLDPGMPALIIVDRDPIAAAYLETLDHEIDEDLFQFKSEFFAPIPEELPEEPDDEMNLADLPKTEMSPTEKINWQAVITKQAQDLHLESLIASDDPVAIINGNFVGIGDTIEGFRVVEIVSGRCIIAKRGIRVALKMVQ
jgi:hypothetical protein